MRFHSGLSLEFPIFFSVRFREALKAYRVLDTLYRVRWVAEVEEAFV
jgi:hypothetical protein